MVAHSKMIYQVTKERKKLKYEFKHSKSSLLWQVTIADEIDVVGDFSLQPNIKDRTYKKYCLYNEEIKE